jgi:hypothetical protein
MVISFFSIFFSFSYLHCFCCCSLSSGSLEHSRGGDTAELAEADGGAEWGYEGVVSQP